MALDFSAIAGLLEQLPASVKPTGALQIMDLSAPFELNPLVPALIVDQRGADDFVGLPTEAARALDDEQCIWVVPNQGLAVETTLDDLTGQSFAALYIPAVDAESAERSLDGLRKIVQRLRVECPWDRKQTLPDLKAYVIEEAYEVVDAIDRDDRAALLAWLAMARMTSWGVRLRPPARSSTNRGSGWYQTTVWPSRPRWMT